MPHRCIKCGNIYQDGSETLIKGCSCGNRFFFFFKSEDAKLQQEFDNLSNEEKIEIQQEIEEIIPIEEDMPVILDFESIFVEKSGKFHIDLVNLFRRKPVVYKTGDGKYFIDIASTFQMMEKGKKKEKK